MYYLFQICTTTQSYDLIRPMFSIILMTVVSSHYLNPFLKQTQTTVWCSNLGPLLLLLGICFHKPGKAGRTLYGISLFYTT